MSEKVFLNGMNGSTGLPLDGFQLTTELLAKVARHERLSETDLRDAKIKNTINQSADNFGAAYGIDLSNLDEAGWGIIFPANLPSNQLDALKDALKPLLDLRKEQATRTNQGFYREFSGSDGYRKGETKNDFLKRFKIPLGAANPELGLPFYLLIVGSPEEIPFSFQYQLDFIYGVGRIYFEQLESYAIYAKSVVAAEAQQIKRPKKAAFFGVAHDQATYLSSKYLVAPLYAKISPKHGDWNIDYVDPAQATKSTLTGLLGGVETPAILFTASHGMQFNLDDARLLPHTGALLCQDFINYGGKPPISEQFYFSADDISSTADVSGTFAFFFACFGAGSPRTDSFYRQSFGSEKIIAPYEFMSRLPLKLLSHPKGGALGVFAHVDRAWTYSFNWAGNLAGNDIDTFRSMIDALMDSQPAGVATNYFGDRYADRAIALTNELNQTSQDHEDDITIALSWTSTLDAQNYMFIGDPAIRLAVAR